MVQIVNRSCVSMIISTFSNLDREVDSCEHLLEYLESSGNTVLIGGPVIRQLCVENNREQTLDEFHIFFRIQKNNNCASNLLT